VSNATHRRAKRARFAPIAIGTGALAAVLLSVTMSGSLAGFTAQITNSNNNVTTGALTMQETSGGTTCNSTDGSVSSNSFTCSTINKYGGAVLVPGTGAASTSTASVVIKNTGTVAASTFTLAPTACTQTTPSSTTGSATDLCSKLFLTVTDTNSTGGATTTIINNVALSALAASYTLPAAAVGNTQTFAFSVTFPSTGSSATDNTYANLKATQQLVWTYNS
jgi:hypothetical protein